MDRLQRSNRLLKLCQDIWINMHIFSWESKIFIEHYPWFKKNKQNWTALLFSIPEWPFLITQLNTCTLVFPALLVLQMHAHPIICLLLRTGPHLWLLFGYDIAILPSLTVLSPSPNNFYCCMSEGSPTMFSCFQDPWTMLSNDFVSCHPIHSSYFCTTVIHVIFPANATHLHVMWWKLQGCVHSRGFQIHNSILSTTSFSLPFASLSSTLHIPWICPHSCAMIPFIPVFLKKYHLIVTSHNAWKSFCLSLLWASQENRVSAARVWMSDQDLDPSSSINYPSSHL